MLHIYYPLHLKEYCFLQDIGEQAKPNTINVKHNSMENTHWIRILAHVPLVSNFLF